MPLTENKIKSIFADIEEGNWQGFFEHVADDVDWTVVNPRLKTFPVAGHYHSKRDFQAAISPLNACFAKPLALTVEHVTVGSTSEDGKQTAVVELRAQSSGKKTGMEFDNYYAWVCVFDSQQNDTIVAVRAYLDSALVEALMAKES